MGRIGAPGPISEKHLLDSFDCGNGFLNDWLKKYALANSRANASKTFVICSDQEVIGYYSLAMGSVDYEEASSRVKKGLAKHPIPVVVLARLAVTLDWQRRKLGMFLLKDACLRSLNVSGHIGARAVFVNAKDEDAKRFYERYGFEALPGDSLKLIILMKDIRHILQVTPAV